MSETYQSGTPQDAGDSPAVRQIERLLTEGPMSPSAAAKLFPPVRGRKVHATTVVAWIVRGKRGVRLEGYRGPGKSWWTSRQAVVRFLAALTGKDVEAASAPTPSQVERDIAERAARATAAIQMMGRKPKGESKRKP